jgi:hypothetical protein
VFTIYHFTGGLLGKLTNPNYAQYAATVLKWLFEMECTTADLGNTFNESAEGLIDQFTAGLGYGGRSGWTKEQQQVGGRAAQQNRLEEYGGNGATYHSQDQR